MPSPLSQNKKDEILKLLELKGTQRKSVQDISKLTGTSIYTISRIKTQQRKFRCNNNLQLSIKLEDYLIDVEIDPIMTRMVETIKELVKKGFKTDDIALQLGTSQDIIKKVVSHRRD